MSKCGNIIRGSGWALHPGLEFSISDIQIPRLLLKQNTRKTIETCFQLVLRNRWGSRHRPAGRQLTKNACVHMGPSRRWHFGERWHTCVVLLTCELFAVRSRLTSPLCMPARHSRGSPMERRGRQTCSAGPRPGPRQASHHHQGHDDHAGRHAFCLASALC